MQKVLSTNKKMKRQEEEIVRSWIYMRDQGN